MDTAKIEAVEPFIHPTTGGTGSRRRGRSIGRRKKKLPPLYELVLM